MTSPSQTWSARFAALGPTFSFDALVDPYDSLYRDPIETAEDLLSRRVTPTKRNTEVRDSDPPYCVAYYAGTTFNAHAACTDGEALVAISAAVPPVVFAACVAVATGLRDADGDVIRDEDGRMPVPNRRLALPVVVETASSSPDEWSDRFAVPDDITTRQFDWAMRMYAVAMRFLVAHEAMHVLLGHAGWRQERHDAVAVTEFPMATMGSGAKPLQDVIEFQADYNAAVSVTRGLLNGPTVRHLCDLMGLEAGIAQGLLFTSLIRALTILAHCFPLPVAADPFARTRSHPHPYLRARSMALAALAAAGEVAGMNVEARGRYLTTFVETVALLETRTDIPSWRPCMDLDNERMRSGQRHSERLHTWRQRHARRAADYFYRWAPDFRLHDNTVWDPRSRGPRSAKPT